MLEVLLAETGHKFEVARRQIRLALHATDASRVVVFIPPIEELKELRRLRSPSISVEAIAREGKEAIQEEFLQEFRELYRKYNRFSKSSTYLNRLANLCELGGDLPKAQEFLTEAYQVERAPLFATKLGSNLLQMGHLSDAKRMLMGPSVNGDIDATLRLASLDVLENNFKSAEERVASALEIDAENYGARLFAGTLCLLKSEFERAIQHFRIAADERSNSSALYVNLAVAQVCLGFTSKAFRSLRVASTLNPLSANVAAFLADLAFVERRNEEAVPVLERFLRYEQKSAAMWARLARAQYELKNYDSAIKALKVEASLRPLPSVFNNLGVTYWNKGEHQRADEFFEIALKDTSYEDRGGRLTALGNLLGHLNQQGRFDKSIKLSDNALKEDYDGHIAMDSLHCVIYLHNLTALSRLGQYPEFLKRSEVILSWPSIASRLRLGVLSDLIYHHTLLEPNLTGAVNRSEEVLAILDQCQDCDERVRNMARNNVAFTFIEANRIPDAEAVLRTLNNVIHKEAYPTATLGLLHIRKGHLHRGEELYLKAIELLADSRVRRHFSQKMHLELGQAFMKMGELAQARVHLLNAAQGAGGLPALTSGATATLNRLPAPPK